MEALSQRKDPCCPTMKRKQRHWNKVPCFTVHGTNRHVRNKFYHIKFVKMETRMLYIFHNVHLLIWFFCLDIFMFTITFNLPLRASRNEDKGGFTMDILFFIFLLEVASLLFAFSCWRKRGWKKVILVILMNGSGPSSYCYNMHGRIVNFVRIGK